MAEKALSALTEATSAGNTDKLFLEAVGGARQISRNNLMPERGAFALLTDSDVDITNDRLWFLDATDGRLREISIQDLVFGNFQNVTETDNFTLIPGTHNVRTVQLGENLPDVVDTITLDGSQAGLGGCDFLLVNFRNAAVTVTASNGVTLYVAGTATDGTIGARQAATVTVNNAGTEAIFSGG